MTTVDEANARVARAGRSKDYSSPVAPSDLRPTKDGYREPDRYSTILGKRVAIMQPVGAPRAREDLSFPTFTLVLDGRDAKGQEKVVKGLDKLARAEARRAKARAKVAA